MRYALAFVCPPLALLVCKKWSQSAVSVILFVGGLASWSSGFGLMIEFGLILWAVHAVGNESARSEAQAFIKTVTPIPYVRL